MDGDANLLACITDDSGLLFLSGCNKAVMPRWLYASCWRRHGVVLRTRIYTLEHAYTNCALNSSLSHRHLALSFARVDAS
jgi:hypothetical protein